MMMRMKSSFKLILLLLLAGLPGISCSVLPGKTEAPKEGGPSGGGWRVQSILALEGSVAMGPGPNIAVLKGSEITLYREDESVTRISGAPKGRLQWGKQGEFLYFIEYDNYIAPHHWMNAGTLKRYSLADGSIASLSADNNVTFYTLGEEELYYISLGSLYRGVPKEGAFRFEKILNGFCVSAFPAGNHIAVYRRMDRETLEIVDKKGERIALLEKEYIANRLLPAYVLSVSDGLISLDARGSRENYRLDGKTLVPVEIVPEAEGFIPEEIRVGDTTFSWKIEGRRLTLIRRQNGEEAYLTHVEGARPLEFTSSGERLILRWSDGALVIRLTQGR